MIQSVGGADEVRRNFSQRQDPRDIIYLFFKNEYGVVKVSTGDLKLEKLSGATR